MKIYKFNPLNVKINITKQAHKQLILFRHDKVLNVERGGVILGKLFPTENTILITDIIESKLSENGFASIALHVNELQNIIDEKWESSNREITYLGDWHTHPDRNPKPSIIDKFTFLKNYHQSKFDQNILLYIILGYLEKKYIGLHNGYSIKRFKKSLALI